MIDEQFTQFHADHPEVYAELVHLARSWKQNGHAKLGIATVFEVLRWNRYMANGSDGFKLNNNYRSRYARLIMENEPDLDGLFEVRSLAHEFAPMAFSPIGKFA